MRSVFSRDSQSLLIVSDIQVHFDGKLRFSCVDECRLGFGVLSFFDESSGLVDEDSVSGLGFVLACNLES
jgi:hypothetical protein